VGAFIYGDSPFVARLLSSFLWERYVLQPAQVLFLVVYRSSNRCRMNIALSAADCGFDCSIAYMLR